MSLCSGSCGGLFLENSCSNQHCDSLCPIRLQPCSDGTDSTSNAVACLVAQFCSCKLPFGSHHLRVHRFVSRTPQHFLFHCRRMMRGSGDVNVGSSNWFKRFVAFRAVRALKRACHVLSGSHMSTRFIFAKHR